MVDHGKAKHHKVVKDFDLTNEHLNAKKLLSPLFLQKRQVPSNNLLQGVYLDRIVHILNHDCDFINLQLQHLISPFQKESHIYWYILFLQQ